MVRPLWRVRACPIQAGAALSGAIETMNSVSDTMDLDRRTWLTHYVIDGRIIAAALDVARNEDSSPEARMYALRTLICMAGILSIVAMTAIGAILIFTLARSEQLERRAHALSRNL